jgi:glycine cleavage system transcriptional repressor
MKYWIVITVVGSDRPGIVAAVSKILFLHRCNIEELSSTILKRQFAMILIATSPKKNTAGQIQEACLREEPLRGMDIHVKEVSPQQLRHYRQPPSQSFIITVLGQDRPGLVYGVTEILAEHGINITSFDAKVTKMRGKTDYAQIYEVEIPEQVDIASLKKELSERGKRLKVEIGLQHRNIFRAINEI